MIWGKRLGANIQIFFLKWNFEKLMQNNLINEMLLISKYIWPCPWKRNAAWQVLNLSVKCVKEDDYTFKTDLKKRWIFCTFDIPRNKQSFWQMVFMLANGFFMLFLFCIVKQALKLMLFCFKNLTNWKQIKLY